MQFTEQAPEKDALLWACFSKTTEVSLPVCHIHSENVFLGETKHSQRL